TELADINNGRAPSVKRRQTSEDAPAVLSSCRQPLPSLASLYARRPGVVADESHLYADDSGFECQLSVDDPLDTAADTAMSLPTKFSNKIQPRTGRHLHAELGFFDAAEADEARPADKAAGVKRGELGRGLDHQHARKQGPPGDVAFDPEFIVP